MPAPKQELSPEELQRMIVDVLARERRSLTATEIHKALPKAFRPASKSVKAVVEAMAKERRLFLFEKRYSTEPDRTVHQTILNALADGPLTAEELIKRAGAKKALVSKVVKELVAEGALHAYPKHEKKVRYGVQPPSAAELLAPQLPKLLAPLVKAAKKLGIDETAARAALRELLGSEDAPPSRDRPVDPADAVLDALRSFNPAAASGALIFLPHLRTAVADRFRDKTSFDRTVLGLLARGAIDMQSHPTPSLLSATEREAMVDNGRGGYYTAIALR